MNEEQAKQMIERLDTMILLLELSNERMKLLCEMVDRIDDSARNTDRNTR